MEFLLLLLPVGIIVIFIMILVNRPPDVSKMKGQKDIDGLVKILRGARGDEAKTRSAVKALAEIGGPAAVFPLCAALKDNSPAVRVTAADALGRIGDKRAIEPLSALVNDRDRRTRYTVVRALVKFAPQTIEPLSKALFDREEKIRRVALEALVSIGPLAVDPLSAALEDGDLNLRLAAAQALGQIGGSRVVKPLVGVLDDVDSNLRSTAARALGSASDPIAVDPLCRLLKDIDGSVRKAAAEALGNISDIRSLEGLGLALYDDDAEVTKAVIVALVKIGSPAVNMLVAMLKEPDDTIREAAVEALGDIGDKNALEPIINILADERPQIRLAAARTLGKIKDPQAIRSLRDTLIDGETSIRVAVHDALGEIGSPQAVEVLISGLTDNEDEVRQAAARALEGLNWQPASKELGVVYWIARKQWDKCIEAGAPAVYPLIKTLTNQDQQMRDEAGGALITMGAPVVPQLIMALQDTDTVLAQVSASLLGEIGDPKAIRPLATALSRNDRDIRKNAALALGQIGDPQAVGYLREALSDQDLEVEHAAVDALVNIGAPAVPAMVDAIKKENPTTRKMVANGLVQMGETAVEPLSAALKDPDRELQTRISRVLEKLDWQSSDNPELAVPYLAALGRLEECREMGESAVSPLARILGDKASSPSERQAAAEVLGKIRSQKAAPALVKALYDPQRAVRQSAAQSLDFIKWKPEGGEAEAAYHIAKGQWGRAIKMGKLAARPLIGVLKDKAVRDKAVDALSRIGPQAVDFLSDAIQDPDFEKRQAVALALGKTGEVRAIDALVNALERGDEAVCLVAPEVLGKIGTSRAVEPLMNFLNHHQYAIRKAAAQTLVSLYKKGNIDSKSKSLILANYQVISQPHTDSILRSKDNRHTDEGIGIDF